MRVLVSGASGFVGTALVEHLSRRGDSVLRLVRRPPTAAGEVRWNAVDEIDPGALDGLDAIVHLAGAGIGDRRWTDARKAEIRDSRVRSTELIAKTIRSLAHPPRVFVSCSAVGYYGDRGDTPLSEDAGPGGGFLSEVCVAWEAAAKLAAEAGVRVVHPRVGIVMARHGGALGKMVPAFRLGLGGPLGSGRQYVPWVALLDLCRILEFLLTEDVAGPVNAVTASVPQRELASTLGAVLGRPAILPAPAFGLRLALGEMASMLLEGQNVVPAVLRARGFTWERPDLEQTLRDEL